MRMHMCRFTRLTNAFSKKVENHNQGNAFGQTNLGVTYYKGQGLLQDYVQTHMWFNLAVSNLAAGADRDRAVKYRDIVAEKMTPAQIAEAQRLAREWKPKHGGNRQRTGQREMWPEALSQGRARSMAGPNLSYLVVGRPWGERVPNTG